MKPRLLTIALLLAALAPYAIGMGGGGAGLLFVGAALALCFRARAPRGAKRASGCALTALTVVLAGCYVPAPTTHAVLQVRAAGSYVLDGIAVDPPDLARVLTARQAQDPLLLLEIHASAQASSTSINTAVDAARRAHLRVAFAGDPATP